MSDEKPPGMKATHKLGLSVAGIYLTIGQFNAIKEVLTGEQAAAIVRIEKAQTDGFDRIDKKLDDHVKDEALIHRRIRDLDREDVAASELRCEKRSDDIKERVVTLERIRAVKQN